MLFFINTVFSATPLPNIDDTQHKTGIHNTTDAAVIIGIEDYIRIPDVPGAAADAQLVRDTLVYTLGIDPARISLLIRAQDQGDASRTAIQQAIRTRAAQVHSGGRLWVYFAGHGSAAADTKERILLGDDVSADAVSFAERSVKLSEIQNWGITGGGQVTVITDACFNGTGRNGEVQSGTRYAVPVSEISKVQLTQWHATSPEQVAQPLADTGHGAFTYFWAGALRGWADGQFSSRDGQVTAQEVQEYVTRALSTMQVRGETPQYTGSGDWVISHGKEVGPELLSSNTPHPTTNALTSLSQIIPQIMPKDSPDTPPPPSPAPASPPGSILGVLSPPPPPNSAYITWTNKEIEDGIGSSIAIPEYLLPMFYKNGKITLAIFYDSKGHVYNTYQTIIILKSCTDCTYYQSLNKLLLTGNYEILIEEFNQRNNK